MKIKAVSIDDEIMNIYLLEEMLKNTGIEVFSFDEPLKALEYIKQNQVDILFVDYHMPVMNGIEVLALVKEYHPELLVIMITAHKDRRDIRLQALQAGVNDFLTKPVDSEEFNMKIKNLLKLYQGRIQLQDRVVHLEKEISKTADMLFEKEFGLW